MGWRGARLRRRSRSAGRRSERGCSICQPCQKEFGLFANASVQYGRQVAFLGADANDTPGDARVFLREHHVSYPSYPTSTSELGKLVPGGIEGYPNDDRWTPILAAMRSMPGDRRL
jgi:hypothetical protein